MPARSKLSEFRAPRIDRAVRGSGAAAPEPRAALRDIGNRGVGDRYDRVSWPVGRFNGWATLVGLGGPASEVLEDAPHYGRVVDQGDHAQGALTLGTDERIGFVDFADEPRARLEYQPT